MHLDKRSEFVSDQNIGINVDTDSQYAVFRVHNFFPTAFAVGGENYHLKDSGASPEIQY